MKFNADGSLAVEKETNEIIVLKALKSLPFKIGRKTILDFLLGDEYNPTIDKHKLKTYPFFGIFEHVPTTRVQRYIAELEKAGALIGDTVLEITESGIESIRTGKIIVKKIIHKETKITEFDRKEFEKYSQYLEKLDDFQKKAIISEKEHIACIAGAGTGKTTVLTKRIQHLIVNKKIPAEKILAITFTKKARLEMHERLRKLHIQGVHIHTFNSFCEQLLRHHENKLYSKSFRIITFPEKIKIVDAAFKQLHQDPLMWIQKYYTNKKNQKFVFIQDCFSILEFYNNNNQEVQPFYTAAKPEDRLFAETMYSVAKYIQAYMIKNGLRDFSNQIKDALSLFRKHPELIPKYEHILIDEYQDVNEIQIKLLDTLSANYIFCVGDPRQSIYGWRGSKIEYITEFTKKYATAEVIYLQNNYRSSQEIVSFANKIIEPLNLPDLISSMKDSGLIEFKHFEDAQHEALAIAKKIELSKTPKNEIFVITRTNKQLEEIVSALSSLKIPFTIKSDEQENIDIYSKEVAVLATAHCVKGLEAQEVFIAGCTSNFFPCYGTEHKVLDLIKDYYDKRSEELRILYVAITRAKKKLHISYYGKRISPFIKEHIPKKEKKNTDIGIIAKLESWRNNMGRQQKIPGFLILSNDEMHVLAKEQPLTTMDLKGIITPHKISRYGKEILEIIHEK